MQLLKPSWVRHEDDKPIFSVDIHPAGGRFATGGQGGQGGRIVIWNIGPVLSAAQEDDLKIPKQLCQMDNHLACVNIIRWSHKGHLLASGSDDKLVMIWKLTGEGGGTVFGGGVVNIETWKCVHTLNSHTGDVLDLAWAPHDSWLASASVDNNIIVWNTLKFPEKVAVLKGHTAMVKGVAWDPVGKYIASQSDDRSLRVWRTADWSQEEIVTDAYVDCSATTHVLRCSWSPDGQYLVSAHAMNGGGPTAQIIERDGWKQDKDFVGHRKAVTCVRFDSNILKRVMQGNSKAQQYCCCAIGSRDRSVSVWMTSLQRPLVVIKDLFDDSVLDISWGSNGLHFLACSWDGTVACIIFDPNEVGTPLTEIEKNALYERIYGKSLQRNLMNQSFTGSRIIESAEMLLAMDNHNKKQQRTTIVVSPVVTPPIAEKSVEKSVVIDSQSQSQTEMVTPETLSNTSMIFIANKQIETRLPGGKRRITPMLLKAVPTTPASTQNVPKIPEGAPAFSSSSPSKSKIIVVQEDSILPSVSRQEVSPLTKACRKVSTSIPSTSQGILINKLICTTISDDDHVSQNIDPLDLVKYPAGQMVSRIMEKLKLQITNSCVSTSKGSLSKIEVFKKGLDKFLIWETFLGSPIRCVQCNSEFIVACCDDYSINCYRTKSGARALPAMIMEATAAAISLNDTGKCLLLTRLGTIYLWDLHEQISLLNKVSIRGLLVHKASISGCTLSANDCPVITLSDGRTFTYSLKLATWVLLSNPLDPLSETGIGLVHLPPSLSLPLTTFQRPISTSSNSCNSSTLPSGATLAYLECQLSSCEQLKSGTEYKYWLEQTVNHLLKNGPEVRLRAILNELLTAKYADKSIQTCQKDVIQVLGLCKLKLLKDLLDLIKTKIPWQRLYKEYFEQLNSAE